MSDLVAVDRFPCGAAHIGYLPESSIHTTLLRTKTHHEKCYMLLFSFNLTNKEHFSFSQIILS